MKKLFFILLFFNLLFASNEPLKIVITKDMIPYTFIDQNNQPKGMVVDYWKLWSKKNNYPIVFIPQSWKEGLQSIKHKKVDVHAGLYLTSDRKKYIKFLKPIFNSVANIYINTKNKKHIKTPLDLNGKTIGVISNTYFDAYIKENYPYINIKRFAQYQDLLQAIDKEKIDSFFDDSLSTWFQLMRHFKYSEVTSLPNFQINKWIHVGIRPQDKALETLVINGMNNISQEEIQHIESKWIIDDKLRFLRENKNIDILSQKERSWLMTHPNVTFALVKGWERFSVQNKEGNIEGFHVDLLNLINKNLSTRFKYKVYDTWSQAYEATKTARVEGIFGLSWSKQREQYFNYSPAYHFTPYYMVTRSKEYDVKTIHDFNKKIAATYENSITNKIISTYAPKTQIIHRNSVKEILQSIQNKEADVALIETTKVTQLSHYSIKIIDSLFTKEGELSIGTNKDKITLASIIQKAIHSISNEQMKTITQKWFQKEQTNQSVFTQKEMQYIKDAPILKVGVEQWKPIIYSTKEKDINGLGGEFMLKTFKKSGLKIQYVKNSWDKLLEDFKKGKIDILPNSIYTKNRAKLGLFSDSYFSLKNFIYVRKDNNTVSSMKDLNHKKVAIVRNFGTVDILKEQFPLIQIVQTDDLEESILRVVNGTADAFLETQIAAEDKIRELLISSLKGIDQREIKANSVHFLSRKDTPILHSIINKSLLTIPTIERNQIISKWLNLEQQQRALNAAFGLGRSPYTINTMYLRGIEYDLIKRILKKSDLNIGRVKNMDIEALGNALQNDTNLDMAVTVKKKNDGFYYSTAFVHFNNIIISRPQLKLNIRSFDDLIKAKEHKIVAFNHAYKYYPTAYKKAFSPFYRLKNYQEVKNQEEQVRDFLNHKTDIIILDKEVFKWHLKRLSDLKINQFKIHPLFYESIPLHVAFRDKNLRDIFNINLEKIQQSGEYDNIFFNYFQSDIEAKVKSSVLISSLVASYIFHHDITNLQALINRISQEPYIKKIEVFNNNKDLLSSTTKDPFKNQMEQESFYLSANIPQKVGSVNVYFDEAALIKASENNNIIPNINNFKTLSSFDYIKEVYKRFGYLEEKIMFSKKEREYIKKNKSISVVGSNWDPIYIMQKEKVSGISKDFLSLIEQKSGLKFKHVFSEHWDETISKFKSEQAQAIGAIGDVAKKMNIGLLSKPYISFKYAIVTKKNAAFIDGLKGLSNKLVAIPQGYSVHQMLKSKYPQISLITTKNDKEAMKLVSSGKAYAYVQHSAITVQNIKNSFPDLKIVGLSQEQFNHHVLLQKSDRTLLGIINKSIDAISNEEKEIIKERWIKTKISTGVDYTVVYTIIIVFSIILILVLFFNKKLSTAKGEIESTNTILKTTIVDLEQTKAQLLSKTEELEDTNNELEVSLDNLKDTQEQLIESEKMASLGSLVAGVAHEVNTPIGIGLTGITHFKEISHDLKKKYQNELMSQEDFEEYLTTSNELATIINSNLNKAANLVRSFKQVAVDQSSEENREFDLKEYMDEILSSLHNLTKKTLLNITIHCEKNIRINSYPGAFSQIISNLIINSMKHGFNEGEKGEISIDITKKEKEVLLVYKDNGKGIPEKNIGKIFEPFFTTKRNNGGSGLGLNIIYNIVTSSLKGNITCESKEGFGVKFSIKFNV